MDWIGPPSLSVMSLVSADVNHRTNSEVSQNAALCQPIDFLFWKVWLFSVSSKTDEFDEDTSDPLHLSMSSLPGRGLILIKFMRFTTSARKVGLIPV